MARALPEEALITLNRKSVVVPPDEQSTLMADILVNLGNFLVEKKEPADQTKPRH
jgi:hypothetical protein